jgi:hypothetical protein
MFNTTSRRLRGVVVPLTAVLGGLALSTPASADADVSVFFEETAEAFWAVPHQCADGSTAMGTLLVRSTRDYETPETEDSDPTVRVQYNVLCPDGSQVSWGRRNAVSATITSTENLKSVTATGSGLVRDDFTLALHEVSFDVTWTGIGAVETSVETTSNEGFRINTSTRKQREATATGQVIADGAVLVDGAANHPTRPAPFIRTDEERNTTPPS